MIVQLNPKAWPADRSGLHPQCVLIFAIMLAVVGTLLVGCSPRQKRAWRNTSEAENYRLALESPSGDERREATIAIGQSRYFDSDNGFGVLDVVARTDPVSQNRCIAIRILGQYNDDRPFGTLLSILQATTGEPADQRKALVADDDVRWETTAAVGQLLRAGVLSETARNTARDVLLAMLITEQGRNIRLAAIQALGSVQDPAALQALIRALRTSDFAMADAAEQSLIALTGTTHAHDADAWDAWLAETSEPFAHAGRKVITTRPAGPSWLEKQKRAFQRAIKAGGTS